MTREYLFRFEDVMGETPYIYLRQLRIIRTTAKGYWVDDDSTNGRVDFVRFVLAGQTAGRRFAYETEDDAWYSFKKRKEWQRKHLEKMLRHVTEIDKLTAKPWIEALFAYNAVNSIFDFGDFTS